MVDDVENIQDDEDQVDEEELKIINEEYKVWKKNSPFLYDIVMTHALDWPSLTCQWLPNMEVVKPADRDVHIHKMLLGTHTSNGEPNYLLIADITLPSNSIEIDARKYDDDRGEVGGFGGDLSKIDIKIRITHEGEVNRARAMPQNNFMIATKSPNSTVMVFDYSKHDSFPKDMICRPQHRCYGHSKEGYGLAWSPHTKGYLLSGSDDGTICLWDINNSGIDVQPLQTKTGHGDNVVEDVDWHKHYAHLFGSVGDDSRLSLWDTRKDGWSHEAIENAHDGDVNCLSFNPFNEYLLATGGSDNVVNLWDLRNMKEKLHTFESHTNGVYQVCWSPFEETILASCSSDRRVNIWDVSRVGNEQTPEDAEDGPPELLFVHGGHVSKISEFSWNNKDPWVVASVSEDNILQIWQMAATLYDEDDDDDDGIDDDDLEAPAPTAAADANSPTKKRKAT